MPSSPHTPDAMFRSIMQRLTMLERRPPGTGGGGGGPTAWDDIPGKPTTFPPPDATEATVGGARLSSNADAYGFGYAPGALRNDRIITPRSMAYAFRRWIASDYGFGLQTTDWNLLQASGFYWSFGSAANRPGGSADNVYIGTMVSAGTFVTIGGAGDAFGTVTQVVEATMSGAYVASWRRNSLGAWVKTDIPLASTTVAGLAEAATAAEVAALTDPTRFVTPATMEPITAVSRPGSISAVSDLNLILDPGFYNVNSGGSAPLNFPPGAYQFGLLVVFGAPGNQRTQVYFPHNQGTGASYYPMTRTKYNASDWGAWARFVPNATTAAPGIIEIADQSEARANADATRAMTPAMVAGSQTWSFRESIVAQSIPTAAWTSRIYPTNAGDGPTPADITYNTSTGLFTVTRTGVYAINAMSSFATMGTATGRRLIRIYNPAGAGTIWAQHEQNISTARRISLAANVQRLITAGTTFAVQVYQDQGAAVNTAVDAPYENFVNITLIAPVA